MPLFCNSSIWHHYLFFGDWEGAHLAMLSQGLLLALHLGITGGGTQGTLWIRPGSAHILGKSLIYYPISLAPPPPHFVPHVSALCWGPWKQCWVRQIGPCDRLHTAAESRKICTRQSSGSLLQDGPCVYCPWLDISVGLLGPLLLVHTKTFHHFVRHPGHEGKRGGIGTQPCATYGFLGEGWWVQGLDFPFGVRGGLGHTR